jgi:hypothetical protein
VFASSGKPTHVDREAEVQAFSRADAVFTSISATCFDLRRALKSCLALSERIGWHRSQMVDLDIT